ncbi:MAG: hypothetical protein HYR56_32580 [Acidobacteria bacterium]|nr:hypothetical protein [Acidobacteriota bacterium]MBI3425069.1 hypothetical protein [Acidobacteriota bacterium]
MRLRINILIQATSPSLNVHKYNGGTVRDLPFAYQWLCGIAFLFFLSISSYGQTCIVAKRTSTEVVIAADSAASVTTITPNADGSVTKTRSNKTACKIRTAKGAFIAIAGFWGGSETGDLYAVAIKAANDGRTLKEKATIFASRLREPLKKDLEKIRTTDIQYYTEKYVGHAVQSIFVGIENGVPTIVYQGFKTINLPTQPVRIKPIQVITNGLIIGHQEAVSRYLDDTMFWGKWGLVSGCRKLIEIQSTATPDDVGGEIRILRITKTGNQWIEGKKGCEDK